MAVTFTFNDAPTSSATFNGQQYKELIVGFRARGLSLPGTATSGTALMAVQAALAAAGRPMGSGHPDYPSMLFLVNATMRGRSQNIVDGALRYTSFTGATPTALIIDVDHGERSVTRSYYPGTRMPIYVGWKGRRVSDSPTGTEADFFMKPIIQPAIRQQLGSITYMQTVTRLTGTKVFYGRPGVESATKAGRFVNVVNDDDFLGRRRGSWKQNRHKLTSDNYGGTTAMLLSAITVGGEDDQEDWRVSTILTDAQTGRVAVPDAALFRAAIEAEYEFGPINVDKSSGGDTAGKYRPDRDGFIVVGPYRPAPFDDIWGGILSLPTEDASDNWWPSFEFPAIGDF